MTVPADREQLRREMRARRRALSGKAIKRAARQFARGAIRGRLLRPGRHIAVYFQHGAEADLTLLIAAARRRHCVLYAPTITDYRRHRMQYIRFDQQSALRANRYGILQPERNAGVAPLRRLDVIFAPLVAVDDHGWRIGSGAGFYDRSLHHLRPGRRWRRPRLIGVGYEFQRVPRLDHAPWDVPLDAVLTEKNLYPTLQGGRS